MTPPATLDFATSTTELTPDDRMAKVAAILARGVLRIKQTARAIAATPPEEVLESSDSGLESDGDPRLTGSRRSGF
jgi:hypothetical protein